MFSILKLGSGQTRRVQNLSAWFVMLRRDWFFFGACGLNHPWCSLILKANQRCSGLLRQASKIRSMQKDGGTWWRRSVAQSSACTDGGALLQHTLLKLMCSWAGPLAIISFACCDFRGLIFADSILLPLLLVPYFQNFRMWGCDVGSLHQFFLNHCGWWVPDDTTVITLPLHEEGCTSVA